MEIWKLIDGFENYMVSNLGRVKVLEKKIPYKHNTTGKEFFRVRKEKIMKPKHVKGYNCISLNYINKRICRLVAIAFIENKDNKEEVNHINCNKADDRVENLEWVTKSENMRHAYKNGLMDDGLKKRKKFVAKKVICLRTGKIYDSISDFSKDRKIDSSNICRALSGVYNNNHDVAYYEKKEM
jgi:hypothetical protein